MMNSSLQWSLFNATAQFASAQLNAEANTHTAIKMLGWDAWENKSLYRPPLNGSLPSFWIGAQRQFWKWKRLVLKPPILQGRIAGNKQLIDARPSVSPWQTDHSSIRGNKGASPQPRCQLAGISASRATFHQSHWSWHKHLQLSLEGIHGIPRSIRSPPWSLKSAG